MGVDYSKVLKRKAQEAREDAESTSAISLTEWRARQAIQRWKLKQLHAHDGVLVGSQESFSVDSCAVSSPADPRPARLSSFLLKRFPWRFLTGGNA